MIEPRVSVIIPTYNRKNELKKCLESVLKQNYKNYDVIVADGDSNDGTLRLLMSFKKRYRNFHYLVEKRRGIGAARNSAERVARGEIVLMTDSDCVVPEDWIERMVNVILSGEVAIQGFQCTACNRIWSRLFQTFQEHIFFKVYGGRDYIDFLDTKNFGIRLSVLKKIGFTNRNIIIGNDIELMARLLKSGYKIKFEGGIRVCHRHPSSLPDILRKYFYYGFWVAKICKKHEKFFNERKSPVYNDFLFISNKNIFSIFLGILKESWLNTREYGIMGGIFILFVNSGWYLGLRAGIKLAD